MGRYEERARALARELRDREAAGLVVVVTAATEGPAVMAALHAWWPDASLGPLTPEGVDQLAGTALVGGLPSDDVLRRLNDRRDTLIARRALVVVAVSADELPRLHARAGDAYDLAFVTDVPFEPDAAVDGEAARRALHAAYDATLGRLDLRGFIRQEREDVAWRIEDVYQQTLVWPQDPEFPILGTASLPELLEGARPYDRPVVLIGNPGSGKTFFVRWCALRGSGEERLLGVDRPLPVLIPLAAFAASGARSLLAFATDTLLHTAPPAAHELAHAVREKRTVILLDGLDEVGTEAGRVRCREAVAGLRVAAAGCPILITCRVAGWAESPLPDVQVFDLEPFDDRQIRSFLRAWCGLYAAETGRSRDEGEAGGEALAADVIANPSLRQLAESPLLLTVLAIVHRAGLRLPDHRVELYDHAITVLVERWNQVRSLAGPGGTAPIRATDALRLLGPVALEMVRSGERGSIDVERLRSHVAAVLARGHVRGLDDPDVVIDVFRRSIGLLVEQAPGRYGFLHLTFVEAFAARELVRSGELESLVGDPGQVYRAEWREIVLLAAGELGLLRADDARLDALVDRLLDGARRRRGRSSPIVPSLLAGLLADDPGLSTSAAGRLVEALVPTWWFERRYSGASQGRVWQDASELVTRRVLRGRHGGALRERARQTVATDDALSRLRARFEPVPVALVALLDALEVPSEKLFAGKLHDRFDVRPYLQFPNPGAWLDLFWKRSSRGIDVGLLRAAADALWDAGFRSVELVGTSGSVHVELPGEPRPRNRIWLSLGRVDPRLVPLRGAYPGGKQE